MAAVLLGVLLLGVLVVTWMTGGEGHTLRVEKPTGGSVLGRYISCGSIGSDCETTIAPGDVVELQAQPDDGYVLVAYSGDCAPVGRVVMDGPRTCAVQFRALGGTSIERHQLTIDPPSGGTIYSQEGGIACGASGTACVGEIEHGVQVTLAEVAEVGFAFQRFTGACASGSTTMNGPQTCGAVFARFTQAPVPLPGGVNTGRANVGSTGPSTSRTPVTTGGTSVAIPPAPPVPSRGDVAPGPTPQTAGPVALSPAPPPADEAPPKSPVEIAQIEIARALDSYREAYSRMDVPAMQRIHPTLPRQRFEQQFRDLRAVEYSMAGAPELSDLDLRAGTVRAQVDVKIVQEMKAGGKQKPQEYKATFVMKRVDESAVWTIQQITYR